ncbi:MAG: MoxR family ATPase [Pirellulales bacterium]
MDNAPHATAAAQAIRAELAKVIVGQDEALDQIVVALIAGGHVLLEGPPGTAKTLLVRSLALAVQGSFRRVQFTPDLMPSDIVGVNVFRPEQSRFEFRPGPLFCDLLLADEINRAPAKTQSALLEAMQERQASVDGELHSLGPFFTVFATQNPIEYEGTYPLPEAQLDRFMFKTVVGYPEEQQEREILRRYEGGFDAGQTATFPVAPITSIAEVQAVRQAVRGTRLVEDVLGYITSIVRGTRGFHLLTLGASPRASVMLAQAAKGLAVLRGSPFVTPDDVRDMVRPVLRHRVVLTPEAEIEGTTADHCLEQVIARVAVPRL